MTLTRIAGMVRRAILRVRAGALAATALAGIGLAGSADRPKFEVASIKLSTEERLMAVNVMPGGRLVAVAPVKLLIMKAYGLQLSEIIGGPDWINTDRYEVNAKAETDTSRDRLMLMLQSLLEDPFRLKAHRERREELVYALVPVKKGHRLLRSKEVSCSAADAPAWSGLIDGAPPCGQMRILPSTAGVRMEGSQVPLSELVRVLAVAARFPVIDRTSLAGKFDIRLDFMDEPSGAPPPEPTGPNLFMALQEQLGLKLELAKGFVEFLAIDHIERPSAN